MQKAAIAAATPLAEAAKASQEELCFFAATKVEGDPMTHTRQMTKLGDAGSAPAMILLDIPDDGGRAAPRRGRAAMHLHAPRREQVRTT